MLSLLPAPFLSLIHIHKHTLTHTHTRMHYIHTHTHTHTHTCMYYAHTHTHTCMYHTHTHTHTHALHTHTHTHIHILHTHTHTKCDCNSTDLVRRVSKGCLQQAGEDRTRTYQGHINVLLMTLNTQHLVPTLEHHIAFGETSALEYQVVSSKHMGSIV